ncbi:MAG TPA: transglutaminase-like domain-containing protein [Polyangiaceae bacterium]|nr:transglutaminase-like domain-containing protein [Polyangiaceae bacterium]
MMRVLRSWPLLAALAVGALDDPAAARPAAPILHEPIPPDPGEDLALGVALDGDLPAALRTPNGLVPAPDPRKLPLPSDSVYGPDKDRDVFVPDRETRRPDVSGYDEPFSPSTAPFKRLEAFDGVRSDYRLYVRDQRLAQVPTAASPGPNDDAFYADLVVNPEAGRNVRIPSVGPGARVVHARLGVGPEEIPMRVVRDGADNWFLQVYGAKSAVRSRLVMEVAIARTAFGGQLGDPEWSALPMVPALPDNVAREATAVRSALHVSRRMRPRQVIAKLVQYFRGFGDSDDSPRGRGSIYLDLALSKKGVCRHRAFAFLVTSLSLGIPTRLVANEAHAWVEVHDGALWRRIDLGGAGRMTSAASDAMSDRTPYVPPPDGFAWPQNARRGGDMIADARSGGPPSGAASSTSGGWVPGGGTSGAALPGSRQPPDPGGSDPAPFAPGPGLGASGPDGRPSSSLSIRAAATQAHRGHPLRVNGTVRADGEPCPHLAVELWLRAVGTRRTFLLGTLATGDDGAYAGGIVVPGEAPLGDYDVIARTPGDARCGAGSSE